jgi:hypothetical protein
VLPFLTALFEIGGFTDWLLAKSRRLWPVLRVFDFFARKKMTRFVALLFAALTMLAGAGHAQAQNFGGSGFFGTDSRDIMGGGPNFFGGGGGASPIPRTTVSFASNYAPGTIVINTAERRL